MSRVVLFITCLNLILNDGKFEELNTKVHLLCQIQRISFGESFVSLVFYYPIERYFIEDSIEIAC